MKSVYYLLLLCLFIVNSSCSEFGIDDKLLNYLISCYKYSDIENMLNSDEESDLERSIGAAINKDDLETLQKILESNKYISTKNRDYLEELLNKAVGLGSMDIVKYLISVQHVHINNQVTFTAAQKSKTKVLLFLLESGADPYARDTNGDNLMHKAVRYNNVELIKELSRYKNLINSTNVYGSTPIDITTGFNKYAIKTSMEMIKVLVEIGSDVPDQLIWNFWEHNISNDMIKFLVSKSGKVDLRITWTKRDCRETLLMMLLMAENLPYDMIKFLLDQGADVNIVYCSNMTALHRAACFERENTLKVIQLFLDNGAILNAVEEKGFTPLDIADRLGNKKVAEYLRKSGGRNTQSYLFVRAADNDDVETMEQMLESDKNLVNRKLDYGETLLQAAATRGSLKTIKYLVSKQHVNINEQDIYGFTALSKAVEAGQLESVKLLLDLGADKNIKWPSGNLKVLEDGSNLLHQAARDGSIEVLRFLLQHFKINVMNYGGETPAFIAAKEGNVRALNWLLEYGAYPYTSDNDGSNMIHAAVKFSHVEVVRELIRFKEMINATDKFDLLPIDFTSTKQVVMELVDAGSDIPDSCIFNYFNIGDIDLVNYLVVKSDKVNLRLPRDCSDTLLMQLLSRNTPPYDEIKLLLDKGADANMKSCDNMTALHRAAYYGGENYQQILKLLLDHGADINARNIYGRTPLDYANENVAAYLSQLGGVSGYTSSTIK